MSPDDYKIEKGVPLPPPPVQIRLDIWTQVVSKMAVDESFLLKEGDDYREPLSILENQDKRGEVRAEEKTFRLWRVK